MSDIPYEMDFDTWETYYGLVTRAALAEKNGDTVQLQQCVDQLRALPGYPTHAHPTEDRIVPVPKQRYLQVMPRKRLIA